MRDFFLDHDIVTDRYGSIYQVLGNDHPPGILYAIKKYVISPPGTPWGKIGFGYRRLIREYSPKTSLLGERLFYDNDRKSLFPVLPLALIKSHYRPEEGLKRIYSSIKDELEKTALNITMDLTEAGARSNNLGITGSILLNIHSEKISDIDVVVYDCAYLELIREKKIIAPFKDAKLRNWIYKNSRRLNLPPKTVQRLYDPRKRGERKGKNVSIIPVTKKLTRRRDRVLGTYIGDTLAIVRAHVTGCQHEYYPKIITGELESIVKSQKPKNTSFVKIISYESLFLNNISDDDRIVVEGKSYYHRESDTLTIVVGVRESSTYAYPLR